MLGYLLAVMIGLILGVLGSGGGMLTMPLLVYLFNVPAVLATTYSLIIIGFVSIIGVIGQMSQKNIDLNSLAFFGIPSMFGVYISRALIFPKVPQLIITIGKYHLSKETFIMIIFAILMVSAAIGMLVKRVKEVNEDNRKRNYFNLMIVGLMIGLLSGFVGAGGGFMIVPALVVINRINIKKAISTSLSIIALNSLLGVLGDKNHAILDFKFLMTIIAFMSIGIVIGTVFSGKFTGEKLRPVFGWFTLFVGLIILIKEIIKVGY